MHLSLNTLHEGNLGQATHIGLMGLPGEGEYAEIQLEVEDGIVMAARFQTYTCPVARASCELVCRIIEEKSLNIATQMTGNDVTLLLKGLPEGKKHLPFMVCSALRSAVSRGRIEANTK